MASPITPRRFLVKRHIRACGPDQTGDEDRASTERTARTGVRIGGGGPRQPHPGTHSHRYGCSLPGLTGFTALRCEGTDGSAIEIRPGISPGLVAKLTKPAPEDKFQVSSRQAQGDVKALVKNPW